MSTMTMVDKTADLAGPGIGNYDELAQILPDNYESLLDPKQTQEAITAVKRYIEDNLCRELKLMRVEVPLIVDVESGINDYLDRDGSRTPIQFHISNDRDAHPIEAQVVQAATKWKRVALKQFGLRPGEGLITDMRAVRKDYFLDHVYIGRRVWSRVQSLVRTEASDESSCGGGGCAGCGSPTATAKLPRSPIASKGKRSTFRLVH
jgi:aspartate--ammonia ligase